MNHRFLLAFSVLIALALTASALPSTTIKLATGGDVPVAEANASPADPSENQVQEPQPWVLPSGDLSELDPQANGSDGTQSGNPDGVRASWQDCVADCFDVWIICTQECFEDFAPNKEQVTSCRNACTAAKHQCSWFCGPA
jgi:hypothetical protein